MQLSKEQVCNAIENKRQDLISLLSDLVSIDTTVGEEYEGQQYVKNKLLQMGLEVDEWTIDLAELSKSPGFVPKDGLSYVNRPLVAGTWRGQKDENSLIINGHIDVVEATNVEKWNTPPFEPTIRDGVMFGRGSCDMKGGVAASLIAMQTLVELGFKPQGNVIYESAVGEEDSVNGSLAFGVRGYKAPMAVIAECTDMKILPANLGTISFNIEIVGKQAHHGLRYLGECSFEKATAVCEELKKFEQQRTDKVCNPLFDCFPIPATINIGRVEAGNERWSTAPWATMECCCEYYPHESAEQVWEEMKNFVQKGVAEKDEWLSENPLIWHWITKSYASEAKDYTIVKLLQKAYKQVRGEEAELAGFPCGADMSVLNLFADTSTVLLGPGSIHKAHTENESVILEDVVDCAKIIALLLLEV